MLFVCHGYLCYTVLYVPCSIVVTCSELDDLLALLCVMFSCVCVTFPYVRWFTSELSVRLVPLNMWFFYWSWLLLSWILFVIYVSRLYLLYCLVCCLQSCDHLLGKGLFLDFLVCNVSFCFCHFSHMVAWVQYGTWLYQFQIFAFLFTFFIVNLCLYDQNQLLDLELYFWNLK